MKNKLLLSSLTLLSVLVLIACSGVEKDAKEISSASSEPQTVATSSSTSEKLTTSSTSISKTEETEKETEPSQSVAPQSVGKKVEDIEEAKSLYETSLKQLLADTSKGYTPQDGPATHYAFYDVDGNDSPEMLTAREYNGKLLPAAIYYLKNGKPTFLAETKIPSAGATRSYFAVNQDGTIYALGYSDVNAGQGVANLYELKADGSGVMTSKEEEFDLSDGTRILPPVYSSEQTQVDLADLEWVAFEREEPASEEGIDFNAILDGDFSDIVGSWKGSHPYSVVAVLDDGTFGIGGGKSKPVFVGKQGKALYGEVNGTKILIAPKGVDLSQSGYRDASDQTRDRIWLGPDYSTLSNPGSFRYRVE